VEIVNSVVDAKLQRRQEWMNAFITAHN